MPTSRRPVRKATTTSRPVTQKTTTRVVQKVVVEKNFNTVIAKIRKDLAGQMYSFSVFLGKLNLLLQLQVLSGILI
jgi:hypothetical protein